MTTTLLALLLSGCSSGTTQSDPSWLRADVATEISTASFAADGHFWVVSEARRREFGISAAESRRDGSVMTFIRRGGVRLTPGDYPVGLVDYSNDESSGIGALFSRSDGEVRETYTATSGLIRIQSSDRSRVTGTFEIDAVRYCAHGPQGALFSCTMAWSPPADAPTLRVTGEFSVAYDDGAVETLPLEQPIPGT